jgi:hypothetical protein
MRVSVYSEAVYGQCELYCRVKVTDRFYKISLYLEFFHIEQMMNLDIENDD